MNKFIFAMLSFILFVWFPFEVKASQGTDELIHSKIKQEEALILKVVASDTIVLENAQRIKLLGVDSFGPPPRPKIIYDDKGKPIENQPVEPTISLEEQAMAYAQNLMESKKVKLEYDFDSRDDRGNKIAYVFLPDGTMANVEMLRQGFVRLRIRPPNVKYEDLFKKAYQEARKEQRGFLSD